MDAPIPEETPPIIDSKEETQSQNSENDEEDSNFRENEIGKRRQFLKEIIISHQLWQEGRFWEQALWQCVMEQVDSDNVDPLNFLATNDATPCRVA